MAPVPWTKVVLWTLIAYGRPPVLVALLVYFGRSYWEAFVAPWKDSGWTDRGVFIVGSWLVHEVLYVGMNGFFYLCDTNGWLASRKLARTRGQLPKPELIRRTWRNAFLSHGILQWGSLFLVWLLFERMGSTFFGPLPDAMTVFKQLVYSVVFLEFSFYTSHRLLHHPRFYKRFHREHHEYTGTIGFASEHAHCVWFAWLFWRLFETYEAHSGYVFPWLHGYNTMYHDYHHTVNIGNFGGTPLLDSLCGTNRHWAQRYATKTTPGQQLMEKWANTTSSQAAS